MSKNKSEYSESITRALATLKQLTLLSGAKDLEIKVPENEQTLEMLKEGYEWLKRLIEGPYLAWRAIRKQQDESYWQRYESDPETYRGFPEVMIHSDALRGYKKAVMLRVRPVLFRGVPKAGRKANHLRVVRDPSIVLGPRNKCRPDRSG